jgi:uncharacterized membrane protein
VPHAIELVALKPMLPEFLSYVLSFIYLGIYWNMIPDPRIEGKLEKREQQMDTASNFHTSAR